MARAQLGLIIVHTFDLKLTPVLYKCTNITFRIPNYVRVLAVSIGFQKRRQVKEEQLLLGMSHTLAYVWDFIRTNVGLCFMKILLAAKSFKVANGL